MKYLVLILFASLAYGQDLKSEFESIMKPTIGKRVQLPNYVAQGGLSLQLSESTKAWQILSNGVPCGVIFEGTDVLMVEVTNPFSLPIAKHNISRTAEPLKDTMVIDGNRLEIRDKCERGILWSWEYANAPVVEDEAAPKALTNWLDTMTEARYGVVPGHELATAKYNKIDNTFVGLFKTYTGNYLYHYDPSRTAQQSFHYLEQLKRIEGVTGADLIGTWVSYRLATEPIARHWWDRPIPGLVSVATQIEAVNHQRRAMTIKTSVKLKATKDNISLWRADLTDGERYLQKLYPHQVDSVRIAGQDVPFVHSNHTLLVHLGKTLMRGEDITVDVVTSGDLAVRTDGSQWWRLGNSAWYPRSTMGGEFSTFEISLTVPNELEPFASGNQVSRVDNGETITVKTVYNKPLGQAFIAAGKYNLIAKEENGKICQVANLGVKKKLAAENLHKMFFLSVEFFEKLYGVPYPFETLSFIEMNGYGYGQAPPAMIFLTEEAFKHTPQERPESFADGVYNRIVHEVSHAWWGDVVQKNSYDEQWLQEGLAEYFSTLFLKEAMGKRGKAEFKKAVGHWRGQTLNADRVSLYLANYLSFYPGDGDRENRLILLYSKGPYVLHAIRGELQKKYGVEKGDNAFYTVVRNYITYHQYKWSGTPQFIELLNQMTGDDWQPFFEKYVYGTDIPEAKVKI